MRILRNPHLWIIIILFILFSVLQYVELFNFPGTASPSFHWGFTRHSADRFLLLIPVVYAMWAFGSAAGLTMLTAVVLASIPRTVIISPNLADSILELVVLSAIGILACYLIFLKNKETNRADKLVAELNSTQKILQHNLDALTISERRLSMLNTISEVLNSSLELEKVFPTSVHLIGELMSADVLLLFTIDEDTRMLKLAAHEGVSDDFAQEMAEIQVGEGIYGEVARTGKILVTENIKSDNYIPDDAFHKMRIQVQMIVPVIYQERIRGIICVASRRPREFTSEEAELMTGVGRQVATAIENATLYNKQRQVAQQLSKSEGSYRRLFEMASEAIWANDLSGTITVANQAAAELMDITKEEMIGQDCRQYLGAEGLEIARHVRRDLLEGKNFSQPYEQKLVKRDGSEIILMVSTSLVRHNDASPVFENVARDVTKERRMQDNLRHYVQQITRIQEEERNRIARDLHDDTAQALYVLTRKIDNFIRGSANLMPEAKEFLTELEEYVRNVGQGVRRFSQDLRPPMLDDLGLMATLRWLSGDMEERSHVTATLTVSGTPRRLAPHVELAIFRIVQEALRNVEKHAAATTVEVKVEFTDKNIRISVADNGKGFTPAIDVGELPRQGRLGLMGMEERAHLLGGSITINSKLNQGTQVLINLLL
jgi:PAS domain S-box-containing protein